MMITTPRAALGSGSISGIRKSRNSPTTTAATRAEACVRAPVASLTADREFDDETGKALVRPLRRFAVPRAVSSRLASTSLVMPLGEGPHGGGRVGERDQSE